MPGFRKDVWPSKETLTRPMLPLPMDQPTLHSLLNGYSEVGHLQRGQPNYAKELVKYIFPADISLAIR